ADELQLVSALDEGAAFVCAAARDCEETTLIGAVLADAFGEICSDAQRSSRPEPGPVTRTRTRTSDQDQDQRPGPGPATRTRTSDQSRRSSLAAGVVPGFACHSALHRAGKSALVCERGPSCLGSSNQGERSRGMTDTRYDATN